MRHFIILIFLWIISLSQTAAALNTFKAKIIDGDSGEPLIGASATVEGTQLKAPNCSSDSIRLCCFSG